MKKVGLFTAGLLSLVHANDIVNLDTVTVTAQRAEQKSLDQSLSISKKEESEIKMDQVVFQKDLLNSISGVNISQTTSVVGHMTSVRTPITTGPYFLFLQDGIAVQSSGFFNHNALAYTNFESASSVEVLKGAGTALYGSDAVAATFNVQTKEPAKEFETVLRLKGGSDDYYSGYAEISDTIDEKHSYRVGGGYTKNRGWRDHTAYERMEALLRYDYALNEDNLLSFKASANKTDAEQAGTLGSLDDLENNAQSVGNLQDIIDEGYNPKRKFDFARASLEWNNYSFEDVEISTIAYARYTRNRYTATWENNLPSNDARQISLGLMQKNDIEFDGFNIIVGLDSEYTDSDTKYVQEFDYVPSGWGSSVDVGTIYDYDVNYLAIAPYLHSDINLLDNLLLSAGLRYDYNAFDYTNLAGTGEYGNSSYYRPESRTDSFSHLSPKLSLSYKPQESLNLYARYANGFRIPQASRLYSAKVTSDNKFYELDAETSDTFEIGAKKLFEEAYVEAAIYYMSINDTITQYEDANRDRYYKNGGQSIHQGIELSYTQNYGEQVRSKIAYSYSQHNYVNDERYGNNEQASAPNHNANVRLYYLPSYLQNFTLLGEVQYISEYWMDNDNENKYSGYTVGNIKADYEVNEALNVFAKVNNITDEKYAEQASFAYGRERYTPAAPRQFFAGLEYTW